MLPHTNGNAEERASEGRDQSCYLLEKLPREVRDEIWKLTLRYPDGVTIDCIDERLITRAPLALLTSCKQIRDESEDFLFSENDLQLQVFRAEHLRRNKRAGVFNAALETDNDYSSELSARIHAASKFRCVHLNLGECCFMRIPSLFPLVKAPFDACREHNLPLTVSFRESWPGCNELYTFDLRSQSSALESVDRYVDQVQATNVPSEYLKGNARNSVERCLAGLFGGANVEA